jgi:hypothetical protein
LADDDSTLNKVTSDTFFDNIMMSVTGEKLMNYIIYDYTPSRETVFSLDTNNGERLEKKTSDLFREINNRVEYYTMNFNSLYDVSSFKEFMINAIFPSIAPYDMSTTTKYNTYIGKTILLMRMLVSNILTERQILEPTDRNDIGRKVYMIAAEVFRRDITRDNGSMIRNREDGKV